MAHERLLAELDKRRAAARRMGGPEKLAQRAKRGQLNAQERLDALVDPGSFIELGLLGASALDADAGRDTARLQDHRLRPHRGTRCRRGRQRLHHQGLVDERHQFAQDGLYPPGLHGARPAVRAHRRVDGRSPARCHGLEGHGTVARQRHHPVPSHPRDPVGGCGARHLVRLIRLAVLLRRFLPS